MIFDPSKTAKLRMGQLDVKIQRKILHHIVPFYVCGAIYGVFWGHRAYILPLWWSWSLIIPCHQWVITQGSVLPHPAVCTKKTIQHMVTCIWPHPAYMLLIAHSLTTICIKTLIEKQQSFNRLITQLKALYTGWCKTNWYYTFSFLLSPLHKHPKAGSWHWACLCWDSSV